MSYDVPARSIVDSGGEWSHFFAAPFDLFEKNQNLRLVVSKPRTNGKRIFVKVSSKSWVSLASLTNLYPSEFCLKTVRGPFFGLESAVVCPGQLERKVNNENENEKDFLTGHFWLYSRASGPNGKTILLPLREYIVIRNKLFAVTVYLILEPPLANLKKIAAMVN